MNDSVYYRDECGVTVNLYIASELDDRERAIGLRQDTRFPDEPRTSFTITDAPSSEWTLRLRIPSWTSSAAVKVNGRLLEAPPGASSYFSIGRTWKKGDRVDLDFPMSLAAEPFPDEPRAQAFLYGPIVLAGDLGAQGLTEELILDRPGPAVGKIPMNVPTLHASGKKLEDWIERDDSAPLTFRAAGSEGGVALRPLNQLWGRYVTYVVIAVRVSVSDRHPMDPGSKSRCIRGC